MYEPLRLGQTFLELADTLGEGFDVIDHLTRLCGHVAEVLDADAAGVLLIDESSALRAVASSQDAAHLLELFELQHEEGPCVDCVRTGAAVLNEPLGHDLRWPAFAGEARRAGYRLTHALPMRHEADLIGAVNVFSADPAAVAPDHLAVAQSLVDVATVGLLQERSRRDVRLVNGQLEHALRSRVAIEQAKGVLAGRRNVDVDTAFETMRRFARMTGARIGDVAAGLVAGTLDDEDLFSATRRTTSR